MDSAKFANSTGGSFRSLFPGFYQPSVAEQAEMLQNGLVVLDTNVLLDLYRYTAEARSELLELLKLVGDRLWIPYRVALEFHRNRISAISERVKEPDGYTAKLSKAQEGVVSLVGEFGRRFGVDGQETDTLLALVNNTFSSAGEHFRQIQEKYDLNLSNAMSNDPVLDVLEGIFDGRIGDRPSMEDKVAALQEATRRAKAKIPPGYKDFDTGKDGERASGDYLLWADMLGEGKRRKLPVILVTNDVKDDWIARHQGLTLGPRPELKEEMYEVAGVGFHIMTSRTFLRQGRDFLQVRVSDATLAEAEVSESQRRIRLQDAERQAQLAQAMADQAMLEASAQLKLVKEATHRHGLLCEQLTSLQERQRSLIHLIKRYPESAADGERELELTREIGSIESSIGALRAELDASEMRLEEARIASAEATQSENMARHEFFRCQETLDRQRSGQANYQDSPVGGGRGGFPKNNG